MIARLRAMYDDVTPQTRRASTIFFLAIAAYAVVFGTSRAIIESNTLSWGMTIFLTAVPIVPFAACLYGGRAVYLAADEMFRRIQSQGMAWGFCLATAITIPYGYFENIHVVPHFRADLVWIILGLGWIAGMSAAKSRLE